MSTPFFYPLDPNLSPPPALAPGVSPEAAGVSVSGDVAATLGLNPRGPSRPFRRDGKGDYTVREAVELVRANVGQVLGTACSDESGRFIGEVPWRPRFGSLLHRLRFMPLNDMTAQLARVYVAQALARWEPRARPRSLHLTETASVAGGPVDTRVIQLTFDVLDASGAVLAAGVSLSIPTTK